MPILIVSSKLYAENSVLKKCSDLDDSRVGLEAASSLSESLPQRPTNPQPKRDSQRDHRNYDQQLRDITLIREIDSQLAEVETFGRKVKEAAVQAAWALVAMFTKSFECLTGKTWLQRLSDLCTGGRGRVMSTKSFEFLMEKPSPQRDTGLWRLFRQGVNILKHVCEIGDFDIKERVVEKIEGSVIDYIGDAGMTARKLEQVLKFILSIPLIKIAMGV